jgi:hypothetical protein
MPTRIPQIVFVVRDQAFNVTVNGLLPLTYHYLYFENKQVPNTQVRLIGGKLGEPLISDANGQIELVYYYTSNLPDLTTQLSEYYSLVNSLAGKKQLVIANINQPELANSYETDAFSYAVSYINIEAYRPTEEEFQAGFGEK